jgi:hypothetical protein
VLVGSQTFLTAQEFADRADCSETAAQDALEQLSEMLIAERQDGRPVRYRRNESYLRWKRAESLAREYGPEELREWIDELITCVRQPMPLLRPKASTVEDRTARRPRLEQRP